MPESYIVVEVPGYQGSDDIKVSSGFQSVIDRETALRVVDLAEVIINQTVYEWRGAIVQLFESKAVNRDTE